MDSGKRAARIKTATEGLAHTHEIAGAVRFGDCVRLTREISAAVCDRPIANIVVNVRAVNVCVPELLGILSSLRQWCAHQDGMLIVAGPSPRCASALETRGIAFLDTIQEALDLIEIRTRLRDGTMP